MKNEILLSTAYLPNIQYISKFLTKQQVFMEGCENFTKQTYRNRCNILGANKIQQLTIPVHKGISPKQQIRDVKISYSEDWHRVHWKSIVSAYNSTPFFEYFADDFFSVFQEKPIFLFDFNLKLLSLVFEILELDVNFQITDTYNTELEPNNFDLRDAIHPKKVFEDSNFKIIPYPQVFEERFGFQPNLSIIDLIFNVGNDAHLFLQKSIQQ